MRPVRRRARCRGREQAPSLRRSDRRFWEGAHRARLDCASEQPISWARFDKPTSLLDACAGARRRACEYRHGHSRRGCADEGPSGRRPDRCALDRDPVCGSRYVHDELHVGKSLKISTPRNNFALVENSGHVILLAGGIGITPIWCMVQRLEKLGRSWKLYYACRSRSDMAFLQALEAMSSSQFHFDDESEGKFLDVASIVAAAPKDAHLYCCGPTPMLKAFEAATANWPRDHIHIEYFTPKQEAAKTGGFVVELARSGQEFVIPEGKSILQVLLDAGVDVDYSCELGICGACEQRVISGTPEHRDAILTEEAQERQLVGRGEQSICFAARPVRRLDPPYILPTD